MYRDRIVLTSRDILEKEFKIDTRGYRPQEVDRFLDMIIKDYEEMNSIIRELDREKKQLVEDNIGLYARACITDKEVIQKARNGELVGWSFGFQDRDVENTIERGMPYRAVKDLDLAEVSILDKRKKPAYDGTLIMARDDSEELHFRGEDFIDEVSIREENAQNNENIVQNEQALDNEMKNNEVQIEEPKQQEEVVKDIDYSKFENMIKEMKEE